MTDLYHDSFGVSPACLERLGLRPYDVVVLTTSCTTCNNSNNSSVSRTVGLILPHSLINCDDAVMVNVTLFDFLDQAVAGARDNIQLVEPSSDSSSSSSLLRILPSGRIYLGDNGNEQNEIAKEKLLPAWKMEKAEDVVMANDGEIHIDLHCLFTEEQVVTRNTTMTLETMLSQCLPIELADRLVAVSAVTLVERQHKCTIVVVESIWYNGQEITNPSTVVRLPLDTSQITVTFSSLPEVASSLHTTSDTNATSTTDCPGYADLQKTCEQLLSLRGKSRPSGLLLTGCAGVGKTWLASSLGGTSCGGYQHWVRLSEFLWLAMAKTCDELVAAMLPTTVLSSAHDNLLVIVDDVQVLASENQSYIDNEKRVLMAAIVQVMDQCVESDIPLLAIASTSSNSSDLPADLVKAGRLEKEIHMEAPTLMQREEILHSLLYEMSCPSHHAWAAALASATAGCVAADLRQICILASTRAQARSESTTVTLDWADLKYAAHVIVPSQLSLLDVVKPKTYNTTDATDWETIHYKSWKELSGYKSVKKRLYRTVVLPWRRVYLSSKPPDDAVAGAIVPPSGVLFHGSSGVGKTIAAQCLGSSLGLPMIRVRAADVLDKWLGGSEAIVRSLFARARSAAPCILFLDEIDAIAANRSTDSDTVDVMSRVLSTLLNEMDGISTDKAAPRVLVVACTNRLEALDSALLRPGRLDEHVELNRLERAEDVEAVLCQYLERAPLDTNVELAAIAQELVRVRSRSGAELEGLCRAAVLKAMRRVRYDKNVCITSNDLISETRT